MRPERIGHGIGRALTAEVVRRSAELGRERLALWVLAGNARARRFYAAAGFTPDGGETSDTYDGVPLREVRYVRDLGGAPGGRRDPYLHTSISPHRRYRRPRRNPRGAHLYM